MTPENTHPQFTAHQKKVIRHWATTASAAEAADRLNITENTYQTHLKRLRAKIRVHRTVDVYRFMLRRGLIEPV